MLRWIEMLMTCLPCSVTSFWTPRVVPEGGSFLTAWLFCCYRQAFCVVCIFVTLGLIALWSYSAGFVSALGLTLWKKSKLNPRVWAAWQLCLPDFRRMQTHLSLAGQQNWNRYGEGHCLDRIYYSPFLRDHRAIIYKMKLGHHNPSCSRSIIIKR